MQTILQAHKWRTGDRKAQSWANVANVATNIQPTMGRWASVQEWQLFTLKQRQWYYNMVDILLVIVLAGPIFALHSVEKEVLDTRLDNFNLKRELCHGDGECVRRSLNVAPAQDQRQRRWSCAGIAFSERLEYEKLQSASLYVVCPGHI